MNTIADGRITAGDMVCVRISKHRKIAHHYRLHINAYISLYNMTVFTLPYKDSKNDKEGCIQVGLQTDVYLQVHRAGVRRVRRAGKVLAVEEVKR